MWPKGAGEAGDELGGFGGGEAGFGVEDGEACKGHLAGADVLGGFVGFVEGGDGEV